MRKVLFTGIVLMLFIAVCVGSASAAVTINSAYSNSNPTFGGDGQQASNPNADDEKDYNIYVTNSISLSNNGASNVTVDGISFVPVTGFSTNDLNITVDASAVVPANGSAAVTLRARIPETLDAVDTNYKESAFKVATATLKSGSTDVASFDVYMQRENQLLMKRAYVIVDEDSNKVTDGDKVDQVKPGSKVDVTVQAENKYNDNDDVEIDAEMFVVIDDRDIDVDEDEDFGGISTEDIEESTISFEVEADSNDGTYNMDISLEGEDEHGARMGEKIEVKFKVEKEKHEIQIENINLVPSSIDCGKIATLTVKLTNIGKEDEEEVAVEVYNEALDYYSRLMAIALDEGDSVTKVFSVPVVPGTSNGDYSLTVKAYWEMGEMTDVTAETLSVSCIAAQEEEEEEEEPAEEEEEEPEQETQDTTTAVPVTTVQTGGSSGSSLGDSAGYLALLIGAIVIVVAAIAVIIVKLFVLP